MESLEGKLGRLTEQLTDAGKWSAYTEASKKCNSLESKIACAESVLRTVVKETRGPITKHNGAGDNGRITESAAITETEIGKGDAALYKGLGISETDQRKLAGLPSDGTKLTPTQLREFRFLRGINLSEADAVRGALRIS
jgi:hypothetical protein